MVKQKGVLEGDFHAMRQRKLTLRYSLYRRTDAVMKVLRSQPGISAVLDIGTADGLMLDRLTAEAGILTPVGLDFSRELLKANDRRTALLIQADAEHLPVKDSSFDAVIVTAVIEHVPSPKALVAECRRALKPGGLCIVTTPDPRFERIATWLGHLKKGDHSMTFSLRALEKLLADGGLQVSLTDRFMISPIGLPGEDRVEQAVKTIGLKFLLMNQLIVAKKQDVTG